MGPARLHQRARPRSAALPDDPSLAAGCERGGRGRVHAPLLRRPRPGDARADVDGRSNRGRAARARRRVGRRPARRSAVHRPARDELARRADQQMDDVVRRRPDRILDESTGRDALPRAPGARSSVRRPSVGAVEPARAALRAGRARHAALMYGPAACSITRMRRHRRIAVCGGRPLATDRHATAC